jgi:hypothetical protein
MGKRRRGHARASFIRRSQGHEHHLHQPAKIVPVTSKINGVGSKFTHTLPAYSATVLQIQGR